MIIRTPEERAYAVEAGKRLAHALRETEAKVRPGITTRELDRIAEEVIRNGGDTPAFKGYQPEGASYPFPAALCISVNNEVVHGIPGDRVLKEGDIVTLDLGLKHNGIIVDAAVTVAVGTIDPLARRLVDTTHAALLAGIEAARPGNRIGDISYRIGQTFKGTPFSVVQVLGGHGVGRSVHEEPYIGNNGHPGTGPEIVPGMLLALEPIANLGKPSVVLGPDDYTYLTRDGSKSAHFEHTILIEEDATHILTGSGS